MAWIEEEVKPGAGDAPKPAHATHAHAANRDEITPVMKDARINRASAWFLTLVFVIAIAIPPVHQFIVEQHDPSAGGWRFLRLFHQFPTHKSLEQFGDQLARESDISKRIRPEYQAAVTRLLNQGSEKIVIGRDGYLFYRTELDLSTGMGFISPQFFEVKKAAQDPKEDVFSRLFERNLRSMFMNGAETAHAVAAPAYDPIPAIADFSNQLKARGIHLLLVPIPVKPIIYPEKLWAGYPASAGPAWNPDYPLWKQRLAEANVDVMDLTDVFWSYRGKENLFLKMDTHWTPAGLALAADEIAARAKPLLGETAATTYTTRQETIENHGDLFDMLELPEDSPQYPKSQVEITRVMEGDQPASGGDESGVLLLGDSFSNVYNDIPGSPSQLRWGGSAGLPQQLMLRLHTPVQAITENGGGASAVRRTLAHNPAMLAGKKLVIWECTTRDLYDVNVLWEKLPLPPVVAPSTGPQTNPASNQQEMVIEGEVTAIAKAPVPGTTPYKECLVMAKYRVDKIVQGKYEQKSIFVYWLAMKDNKLTPSAAIRVGKKQRITLVPLSKQFEQLKKLDLDDDPELFNLPAPMYGEAFEAAR